jgi:release factor glutamine methyltransferase
VSVRTAEFGPVRVRFDRRVLSPRGWTLLQSRWAAELAEQAPPGPIAELCAGVGSIGLAAAVLSGRDLVQVEVDAVAAGFARTNAAAAGLATRVEVRQRPLQRALRRDERRDERFPLMLADPPYLRSEQVQRWPADPVSAIDGGKDGLRFHRLCVQVAARHLLSGAPLLLQVAGAVQARAVRDHVAAQDLPLRPLGLREVDAERAVLLLQRV